MPWRVLRLGASDANHESKRQSVVEAQLQSRHSEHLPRPSPSTSQLAPRHSESAPRSPILNGPDEDHDDRHMPVPGERTQDGLDGTTKSGKETPTLRRNRFSFMRLRHASDPQLSASYAKAEEDVPPVPPLPPPPTIITTAPTSHEIDQPVKRKNKLNFLPRSKKSSMEDLSSSMHGHNQKQTLQARHVNQGSIDSQGNDPNLSASRVSTEEPGRLSITSIRSGGRDHPSDSHTSSVTDPRFSESSRSDQSSGDHGVSRVPSPREDGTASSKRFRLPRLKRNRAPLFPLPPKPSPSESALAQPPKEPTPKPNLSKSAAGDATPSSVTSDGADHDHVSPMPSPARSSAGLSSGPPLLRADSTTSACSAKSSSSNKGPGIRNGRERSSTIGSMADIQDEQQSHTPHMASPGRTSTSTSGRKSFGDLFSISQRLRQNSEPPFPRNGSPGVGGPGTPISKPGSFSIARELPSLPEREESDTPATYLSRLQENVSRGSIAGALSQSGDEFFKTALRKYMRGFSFFGDPIDMAIRKLLMEVELPKETQQIDRVLQGFADRYHECNPGIFASTDQAYFIAFSILILHTDVFNKNNKRKMQKPDYVKNTRGEGISEEILACFYENISYTPFIHIEDANFNPRHLSRPRRTLFKTASSEHLTRASREPVDPYALILDGKLDTLRPSLKDVMELEDTYSCYGTFGPLNMNSLHQAFAKASILQIVSARSRPDAFMTPSSIDNPADSHPGLVDIKVAKVGLLWRKDPKKKRARSPWQEWGALLTFSQLYFFRDVNWVKSLMSQHEAHQKSGRRRAVVFNPPLTEFKPDAIMSTVDAVALLDSSYRKHKHAFVYLRHNSLEEVFLANSDADMNDWLAKLNYAAAFRTTGVRSKGMIATNYENQRDRMGRLSSVVSENSLQSNDKEPPSPNIDDADMAQELVESRKQLMQQRIREANEKLFVCQTQLEDLLRNARHLQLLTPVNARAREQVIMAAGRMSAKLKWVRQDIWRTRCYREVLVRDLGEDERKQQRPAAHLSPTASASTHEPSLSSTATVDRIPSIRQASPSAENPLKISIPTDLTTTIDSISSPTHISADIRRPSIPSSITSSDIHRAGRRFSADLLKERAKSYSPDSTANKLEREASVLSNGSKMDVASLASRASKATASRASFDEGEERILRESGLLDVNPSPRQRKPSSVSQTDEGPKAEASESLAGEQGSRTRRSLHRSLRDSYHGNHHRGKKARDSTSSAGPPDDEQGAHEGEGLSRKSPRFTVHGKKASVVTFGSEWQSMSAEERLKLRKPTPSDEPNESIASESLHGGRPQSLRSASTATKSLRPPDDIGEPREVPEVLGDDDQKGFQATTSGGVPVEVPNIEDEPISPLTSPASGSHGPSGLHAEDESSVDSSGVARADQSTSQEKLPQSPLEQAVSA